MPIATTLDLIKKPIARNHTTEVLLGLLFAVLLTIGALLLTRLFWGALNQTSYVLFFVPVIVSAWIGGMIPGIAAGLFSVVVHDYFLLEPAGTLMSTSGDLIRFLVFLLVVTLVSGLETGRRRSEIAAQEARDELLVMVNAIADGVSAQTADGAVIFANNAAAEISQYRNPKELMDTSAEAMRRKLVMLDEARQPVPPERLPRMRVFAEGKALKQTYLMKDTESGYERWITINTAPVFDKEGKVRLAVNIFSDITDRKSRETELLNLASQVSFQKARLDNVIRNLPGIIWETTGGEGRQTVSFVSPYVEKMLGYKAENWTTDPGFWNQLVPEESLEANRARLLEIMQNGGTGIIEFQAKAADGRIVDIASHTSIINDSLGQPVGACGVMMDVSEQKKQERSLIQTADALSYSNRELEQFAYVASHDLQEPLRMVTSYLQLLENRLGDTLDEESREYIDFAVDGSSRMKKLITDLLIYSRVQRGELAPKPVEMEAIMERTLHNLQVAIEESGATVTHDKLPMVMGDEAQMLQLLQNLVNNAIKFRGDKIPVVHVGVEGRPLDWLFSIKDNGIGIDTKFADRIFVIFQRLNNVRDYSGTGIGLAICKKIVQRHGGEIWVTSEEGKGSTFFFTIPRARKVSFKVTPAEADQGDK